MDSLTPGEYGRLFVLALILLPTELAASFPFYFAPGWANGWPGGLSIHRVWTAGATTVLFVMLMTAGMGAGSAVCGILALFAWARRSTNRVFAIWTAVCVALSAIVCVWGYREIYVSTLEMWPQGYPAGRAQ
jgi:hypothetical protein